MKTTRRQALAGAVGVSAAAAVPVAAKKKESRTWKPVGHLGRRCGKRLQLYAGFDQWVDVPGIKEAK